MLADERCQKIVELTNEKGFVSTEELAKLFNVTETTIRRDSKELENKGLLIRVHGGTKSLNQNIILSKNDEVKMTERSVLNSFTKDIVCKLAAQFVKDGDCIFLDGGSSIVGMLKYLKGKKIKIVTHSSLILNNFDDEDIEVFVIGGKYLPEYAMSIGPITLSELERFNFDHAFISCAGIDIIKRVVYTAEMDTMAVKQLAMSLSVHKYLLCDTSKFKIRGFCSFINSDDFDAVICNYDKFINDEDIPNNFILVTE